MDRLKFLREQYDVTDNWTNRIIEGIEEEYWGVIPEVGTSLDWLMGHQTISKYFHSIFSVVGSETQLILDISKQVPLEDYFKYYFAGSDPKAIWADRPSSAKLLQHWRYISNVSRELLPLLEDQQMDEETEVNNPVAQTKFDALLFTVKHQMWHNGQISMLKRVVNLS